MITSFSIKKKFLLFIFLLFIVSCSSESPTFVVNKDNDQQNGNNNDNYVLEEEEDIPIVDIPLKFNQVDLSSIDTSVPNPIELFTHTTATIIINSVNIFYDEDGVQSIKSNNISTINNANFLDYFEISNIGNTYLLKFKKNVNALDNKVMSAIIQINVQDLNESIVKKIKITLYDVNPSQAPNIESGLSYKLHDNLVAENQVIHHFVSTSDKVSSFRIVNNYFDENNIPYFRITHLGELKINKLITRAIKNKYRLTIEASNRIGTTQGTILIQLLGRSGQCAKTVDFVSFKCQFHLLGTNENGKEGEDLNVVDVWDDVGANGQSLTGHGIEMAIIDTGVHTDHNLLTKNLSSLKSIDLTRNPYIFTNSPAVRYYNTHGSKVTGLMAQRYDRDDFLNYIVGVAYNAKYRNRNLLETHLTVINIVNALTTDCGEIHVANNSWGPSDNGKLFVNLSSTVIDSIKNCIDNGRNGKGTIYVWAAGNGGSYYDNSNLDYYARLPYVLPICVVNKYGKSVYYSEPGANILACTPGHDTNSSSKGNRIDSFNGTSAAAPLASGVIALILQANPNLGWRDVQIILAKSARRNDSRSETWSQNGAGNWYSHLYGFGIIDAKFAVKLAKNWTNIDFDKDYTVNVFSNREAYRHQNIKTYTVAINSDSVPIKQIDKVQLNLEFDASSNLTNRNFRNLHIIIQSPYGTQATVAQVVTGVNEGSAITNTFSLKLLARNFLEENPQGNWTVTIANHNPSNKTTLIIKTASLTFKGLN